MAAVAASSRLARIRPRIVKSSYDELPYPAMVFPQSHPNRLATVAALHGMDPAPPPLEACRVLELGCATGGNLIPMALEMPGAHLLGIELSAAQAEAGQAAIASLGLTNARIEQGDILSLAGDLGQFDYIVAHGVYSWVPEPVRDALLAACRKHLAPNGVAYLSYNTLPGWRLQTAVRDLLLFHAGDIEDGQARISQSMAIIDFMCRSVPDLIKPYRSLFENLARRLDTPADRAARLFHDLIADVNEPVYFEGFAAHAAAHGLRFLAEADEARMGTVRLPRDLLDQIDALDENPIRREQYLDFVCNRTFRQSLLCRADVRSARLADPATLAGLWVRAELRCEAAGVDLVSDSPLGFTDPSGVEGTTRHPLTKAALLCLSDSSPRSVEHGELHARARARLDPGLRLEGARSFAADARELDDCLLQLYRAGSIELSTLPPVAAEVPGVRPLASPWARRRAATGETIINLQHQTIAMEPLDRQLLVLADGTRDRVKLHADLFAAVERNAIEVLEGGDPIAEPDARRRALGEQLEAKLRRLADFALLLQ